MNYTMFLYELLLFASTLGLLAGVPLYMYFRNKMVNSAKKKAYSRRRILKITGINIALLVTVYLTSLTMLIALLLKAGRIDILSIFVSVSFLVATGLAFYGGGIYITSIVLEALTLSGLKRITSSKTQFIATHLFHGPISHVLIYSGYLVAFFLLSLLDMLTGQGSIVVVPYLMICGLVAGVTYALAQIFNDTLLYQFLTCLFSFALFLLFLYLKQPQLFTFSVASYFFSFAIAFLISGLVYYLSKGHQKENIWDL